MRVATFSEKETASGRLIDLLCPDPADVDMRDVVRSLALTCRFGGHVGDFYSVAQHSVFVADLLDPNDRVHGLLHDAPEYLIGDLGSPVKAALASICPDFKRAWSWMDGAALKAIYSHLGIPLPTSEQKAKVKRADLVALATEQRDVMRSPNAWNLPYPAAPTRIVPLTASSAFELFRGALAGVGIIVDAPPAWVA